MKLKNILLYALIAAGIIFILEFTHYLMMFKTQLTEWLIALFALLFIALGVLFTKKFLLKENQSIKWVRNDKGDNEGLTKRELEVLEQLVLGKSNKEIADSLYLSVPTVKTHISNIYSKLQVQRRTQAVQKTIDMGIFRVHTSG